MPRMTKLREVDCKVMTSVLDNHRIIRMSYPDDINLEEKIIKRLERIGINPEIAKCNL